MNWFYFQGRLTVTNRWKFNWSEVSVKDELLYLTYSRKKEYHLGIGSQSELTVFFHTPHTIVSDTSRIFSIILIMTRYIWGRRISWITYSKMCVYKHVAMTRRIFTPQIVKHHLDNHFQISALEGEEPSNGHRTHMVSTK